MYGKQMNNQIGDERIIPSLGLAKVAEVAAASASSAAFFLATASSAMGSVSEK